MKKVDPLEYPISEKPNFGEPLEVSEDIFLLKMSIPYALDHINLWLLRDAGGWTIVDSGYHSEEVVELWKTVLSGFCNNEPIQKIIITHFHPDHVGMAQWLADTTGAPIYMSQIEYLMTNLACQEYSEKQKGQRSKYFTRFGLPAEKISDLKKKVGGYLNSVPEAPVSYQRLEKSGSITINDEAWQLMQFSGHSPGHICLFNMERKVLISGDQILPSISSNVSVLFNESEANPLADFLYSLQQLSKLDKETRVLPSHGYVFIGVQERARILIDGHQKSLEQLRKFCRVSRTGYECVEEMFGDKLSLFNLSLATGEAMAHLNYLVAKNVLSRSDDPVYRYTTN
ncbi:MAG: MBL fold metallo-hydrolase [Cycloclasticus sp. symbiont of Poecilosclerida sp. M]|nr:MAG: MBL fold metallo-hydrolase [Cycloclasticus sp. symbiont of Poecilosclerida sp. M]